MIISFIKKILPIILIFSCSLLVAQSYNKEKLQRQSREIKAQIEKLNKSLNKSKSGSKKSLLYIKSLEEKIKAQDKLMRYAAREKRVLEDEIYLGQLEINKRRREMAELKKEYKDVLVNAYKNKSLQNKVIFILSARNFTEAFRRLKYLEKYSGFQGEKADEIEAKRIEIEKTVAKREKAKEEKEILLAKQKVLRETLGKEREEQREILKDYRKNENQIAANIKNKTTERRKLNDRIQRIIEEEIRIAREKEEAERRERERLARLEAERIAREKAEAAKAAKATASTKTETKTEEPKTTTVAVGPKVKPKPKKPVPKFSATAEATLSKSFVASKGRLPWPVATGKVVGKFGRQPHPVLPNIIENHAGVMIATSGGSKARAVYKGKIQSIMSVQGGNKAIIISHGSFFTVYNNLSSVSVSKGQEVSTKQNIGTIYTDSDSNTIIDFQVWKGTSKQNPAIWLTGM